MSNLIGAAKQALEALEKFRYHLANNYEINAAITSLRQAIAEAEKQEQDEPDDLTIAYMSGLHRGKDLAQQRTWVGLTYEDKRYLNEVLNLQGRFPVIDAIEAKLKEKNTII
jgi:hypothetical protein